MKQNLFILVSLALTLSISPAFADHLPGSMLSETECSEKMGRDCFCWEQGTCKFTEDPLAAMLKPYDAVFGGLALVIFWALVVGLLWLRTESPQLVGIVGIAMVSSYMAYLFGARPIRCADAADSNDDGATDISDGIHLLQGLFLGGPSPASPYPRPGIDYTGDLLGCGE